ncbi:MAG: SWI/SNF chromatin-remodeling complex subunit [Vezdaea aestivalis]|nr:MAG: SWI/SNF chromatin-remodeling complex subunit [Vezdaea aestivalis]
MTMPSPTAHQSLSHPFLSDNGISLSHRLPSRDPTDPLPVAVTLPVGSPASSITQSKLKAKAVLAAASSHPDFEDLKSPKTSDRPPMQALKSPLSLPNGARPPAPANSSNGPAGATSRKRSRSGSRIEPASPATKSENAASAAPSRPTVQALHLEEYVARDLLHSAALREQGSINAELTSTKRKESEFYHALRMTRQNDPQAVFGTGFRGYGNGHTNGPSTIVYPDQRKRAGSRAARPIRMSRKEINNQANQLEELVPVRIDIDMDKVKLRDTFTWNLNDRVVHPQLFAENLVEDYKVPRELAPQLVHQVTQSIRDQIQEFYPHIDIPEGPLEPHLPYFAYKNDEMRILVKLNITVGALTLVDQFEWDINNPDNSPEDFARQTSRDLALTGEFTTAIAHSIREQSQLFTRSLYITDHPFDGRPIEDADLESAFLSTPLNSVFRPQHHAKEYTPYLYELNDAELERAETSMSREQRRQKRSVSRRGGPALPDLKERQRTVRTMLVSSILPGAVDSVDESRLFKRTVAAAERRHKRGPAKDDESEESDSEDSGPGTPPAQIINTGGTARTRGMRGAATAAQAAMRAGYGRSATPEQSLSNHEHRISHRRTAIRDTRDDSSEPKLMVRLKLKREKYRVWWRKYKADRIIAQQKLEAQAQAEAQAEAQVRAAAAAAAQQGSNPTSQQSTPNPNSMGPPSTPGTQHQQLPDATPLQQPIGTARPPTLQFGAVVLPTPPQPGQPGPPPPTWLITGLAALRTRYPKDSFEGTMRHTPLDPETGNQAQQPYPANVVHQYLPRIRCYDCPGKVYTPGPDMSVENFETHLTKNRQHRERVDKRTRAG